MSNKHFIITSIGWGAPLIHDTLDRVQHQSDLQFRHIVLTDVEALAVKNASERKDVYTIRNIKKDILPIPDLELLASLEAEGVPTIHNMILGDRIVSRLPKTVALAYATLLATRITSILRDIRPNVVIGAFDSMHAAMGLAVCRSLGIPWFALSFTAIPTGFAGFCDGISPAKRIPILRHDLEALRAEAASTLLQFEQKQITTPVYVSAHSWKIIALRLPDHFKAYIRIALDILFNKHDKFTTLNTSQVIARYFARRKNTFTFPNQICLRQPPDGRYALFAFHMQPESSIDAWAPFFSNQLNVLEQIVRSMPPNLKLLVKIHISACDNYNSSQLKWILNLPNVEIIAPATSSRIFIEKSALIFGIQGTICLEAALLGKPVLMFGDSPYLAFPSVSKIGRITDLPKQILEVLKNTPPTRERILNAYSNYLSYYHPMPFNDWKKKMTNNDIENFTSIFNLMRKHLQTGQQLSK